MPLLDPPDTIIMSLTLEARNLIARVKFGELSYQLTGWQFGRGGYQVPNVVKVTPLVDVGDQAVGYIEIVDNTSWNAGDQVVLNGKSFIRSIDWVEGLTANQTALNILSAINNSTDSSTHYRQVLCDLDPTNANRIRVTSLVVGNVLDNKTFTFNPTDIDTTGYTITIPNHGLLDYVQIQIDTTGTLPAGIAAATNYYVANATTNTFQLSTTLNTPTVLAITGQGTGIHSVIPTGNLFPINALETVGFGDTINFAVTPMSLALSAALEDPAYPVPPTLGTFYLPDGRIETPSASSISFVMRIPDGPVGLNAYGEMGLYATVLESSHPMETGRQVLFAQGHFPLQSKTDRSIFTYRIIINF